MFEIRIRGQGVKRLIGANATGDGQKARKARTFNLPQKRLFFQEGFGLSEAAGDAGRIDLEPGFEYRLRVSVPRFTEPVTLIHLQYSESRPLVAHQFTLATGTHELTLRVDPRADACALGLAPHGNGPALPIEIEYRRGPRVEPISSLGIIIGAMKSGTTSLFDSLACHPAICPNAISKEANFFSSPWTYSANPVAYACQYDFDPSRHRIALEASPSYTQWPRRSDVPGRMKRYDARYKLVYILRNPVDRLESHLAHNIEQGRLTADQAVRGEHRHYLATSGYASQLDQYMNVFDRSDILLLDFDELVSDQLTAVNRALTFFDIEPFSSLPKYFASNRRQSRRGSGEFRLSDQLRSRMHDSLVPDIERLISDYGFSAARKWLRP
jgi:hypothetical protein